MITEQEREQYEHELKDGFTSFYNFSLSLIESLSKDNNHLRFAVVNMQVALELFLKYYFIRNEEPERIFNRKNGKIEFKNFSVVLNGYFSNVRQEQYAKKKHLVSIMESRNAIVHKGKGSVWNEDLADYIISCAFFIQGVLRNEFSETLFRPTYSPHSLSNNLIWKQNAEKFAIKVSKEYDETVLECPHCYSNALIRKEIFDFDDTWSFDNYQCLSCLVEIDTDVYGKIIDCCQCDKKAYYVDILNPQINKTLLGGCLSCGNKMDVRSCDNCERYYFPDINNNEVSNNNKYFCSKSCLTMHIDN